MPIHGSVSLPEHRITPSVGREGLVSLCDVEAPAGADFLIPEVAVEA